VFERLRSRLARWRKRRAHAQAERERESARKPLVLDPQRERMAKAERCYATPPAGHAWAPAKGRAKGFVCKRCGVSSDDWENYQSFKNTMQQLDEFERRHGGGA